MRRDSLSDQVSRFSGERNQSGVYRAFLAEPYDGIGRYTKIVMSRSSSSASIRAKIAAGDFALSQNFPTGTPVTVFSNRGRIEILDLGNKG